MTLEQGNNGGSAATKQEAERFAKDRAAIYKRRRELAAQAQEIGPLPEVVNPDRKEACRYNLPLFLKTYFPHSTGKYEPSADHLVMQRSMQRVILKGGRRVNAYYRGGGKTTTTENSAIWAGGYGHRLFLMLFGADQESADAILDSIKTEIETNELLAEDFPEICYPVACLGRSQTRCRTQTLDGQHTLIQWGAKKIVLPTVYENGVPLPTSGVVIRSAGIDCSFRGAKLKRADGTSQRPDLVIMDDVQTDETAANPNTVRKTIGKIRKSVLKLAGHDKEIAAVFNATVIEEDDVVDTLLDPKRHPEWQGVRIPMVKSWADLHEKEWLGNYARIRNTYDNEDPADKDRAEKEATEYYRENRDKMDAGCEVSWVELYDRDKELSAIQHAYNALIDDGVEVFNSEYQNNPRRSDSDGEVMLRPHEFATKTNGVERLMIPDNTARLVMGVDVQQRLLFYTMAAVSDQFDISIVDYGAWPDQRRDYFTYAEARATIARKFPGQSLEFQLRKALEALVDEKLSKVYRRTDGVEIGIDICLIDAGFMTDEVRHVCAGNRRCFPAFGKGIRASEMPMLMYRPTKGERRSRDNGVPWRLLPAKGEGLHVQWDTNATKTFIHRRIATPGGNPGALTLFGNQRRHEMFADNVCGSEYPGPAVTTRGRTVYEWKLLPSRPDNHFFDTANMCVVGASMLGVNLLGLKPAPRKKKRKRNRVSYL